MSRRNKTIGDLADSVLAEVDREQVVKTAALAHTSSATMKSDLGKLLAKTAEHVHEEAVNPEISYSDLAQFRKKYDV